MNNCVVAHYATCRRIRMMSGKAQLLQQVESMEPQYEDTMNTLSHTGGGEHHYANVQHYYYQDTRESERTFTRSKPRISSKAKTPNITTF